MFSSNAARRKGFTLIELLIVIVVIAILALIVIPRVMGAGRKAKEATLKGNLHEIRNALEQFQADTGCYPASLTDLVNTADVTKGIDLSGNNQDITPGSYKGPYLTTQGGLDGTGIPSNPFQATAPTTIATDLPLHWKYDKGIVSAAVPTSGNTLDNVPYSSL